MCFKMGEGSQMSLKYGMEKEMGGCGAEPVVVAGLSLPLSWPPGTLWKWGWSGEEVLWC